MAGKQRERLLIAVVVLCVVALGGDRLVATPLLRLWGTRAEKIDMLQRKIAASRQARGLATATERRWKEMTDASQSTDDTATESAVLTAVSRWASVAGVTVTAVNPHWTEDEDLRRRLEIRTAFTGSLASAARFIYELESDAQPLKIEEMSLSAKDDKGQVLNGDVRFTRLVLEDDKKR